ncbi:MAG TPA: putative quinol monooxygenase [Ilumatobacteraceae bacterium]
MIVIAGTFPIDGSRRDEIAALVTSARAATLQEDGCVEYRLSFPADDANTMLIFEEWRDSAALGVHGGGDNVKAFGRAIREFLTGKPALSIYEVSTKGPLG